MRYGGVWLLLATACGAAENGNVLVKVWPNGDSNALDLGVVGWSDGVAMDDFLVTNADIVTVRLWKVCLPGALALDEAVLLTDLNRDGDTNDQLSDCESDPLVAPFIATERYDIATGQPLADPKVFSALEGSEYLAYTSGPSDILPGESLSVPVFIPAGSATWVHGEYEGVRLRMGFEANYRDLTSDGTVDPEGLVRAAYNFGVRFELDCDLDGDGAIARECAESNPGWGDCDDFDVRVKPGVEESCNNVDDDCDGQTDEGC